jgi:L-asparagine transporter-like permease
MQNTETLDQLEAKSQLHLSEYVLDFLRNTQGFARFLGIVGYVFTVLFFVGSLYILGMETPRGAPISFGMVGFVYLLITGLNFFVAHFCFLFGLHLHRALQNKDTLFLENAFKNLMYLFRIIGVTTIIVLIIYAFIFLVGLIK